MTILSLRQSPPPLRCNFAHHRDRPKRADRDAQAAVVTAFSRQEGRLIMIDAHDRPHLAGFRRQAARAGLADGVIDLDADLACQINLCTLQLWC